MLAKEKMSKECLRHIHLRGNDEKASTNIWPQPGFELTTRALKIRRSKIRLSRLHKQKNKKKKRRKKKNNNNNQKFLTENRKDWRRLSLGVNRSKIPGDKFGSRQGLVMHAKS
nr:hypothetical protein BaRGS_008845 [Batillaria attramentaria]